MKVNFLAAKDNNSDFKTAFVCAWDIDIWIFVKTDRLKADLLWKAEHNPLKKSIKLLAHPLVTFSYQNKTHL